MFITHNKCSFACNKRQTDGLYQTYLGLTAGNCTEKQANNTSLQCREKGGFLHHKHHNFLMLMWINIYLLLETRNAAFRAKVWNYILGLSRCVLITFPSFYPPPKVKLASCAAPAHSHRNSSKSDKGLTMLETMYFAGFRVQCQIASEKLTSSLAKSRWNRKSLRRVGS